MNKNVFLVICLAVLIAAGVMAAETLKVTVKTTKLRKSPKFYSSAVATLNYGDTLQKLDQQGDWIQGLTTAGLQGWVHGSAVEEPSFSLTARRTQGTATTADEVALAGKGFNEQVEDAYQKTADLDYTWVNRMEQISIGEDEMERFLREGRLGEFGGGQ
jgi:uncharacterized protein YgiM (DUF1202 family)